MISNHSIFLFFRQLLGGVDQLKILAQVLSTIDKFTEESDSKDGQQKPKQKPDKEQNPGNDT